MKMFMKRSVCVLAFVGLCASLSAIDFQKRNELGLSGILIFSDTVEDTVEVEGLSNGTFLPFIDAGFYGQLNLGPSLHFGMGFRVASIILATMTWPTVYAELDLWRFSLNARLGGGFFAGLAGFYPFFLIGDALLPEVSLWFRFARSRLGVGALTLLSASSLNATFFEDFGVDTIKGGKVLLYISYIWSLR
ncbi:MAG: hypothetical protein LBD79_11055 [Treponema sp.]|jgi:hypothetical protein|nr:hypothetical protein [Treponema sp.]